MYRHYKYKWNITNTRFSCQSADYPFIELRGCIDRAAVCLIGPGLTDEVDCKAMSQLYIVSSVLDARRTIGDRQADCRRVMRNHVEPAEVDFQVSHARCDSIALTDEKGARFSTPSSETVDTNAIGLGTIPLIMRE